MTRRQQSVQHTTAKPARGGEGSAGTVAGAARLSPAAGAARVDARAGAPVQPNGLGVRSPVAHSLHPTAQKILAAAKRILSERGYPSMTLQAISTEAGVNKAGVWYYFGGKRQLLDALLEDVLIRESHHFGIMPPDDAPLEERIDLIVGSASAVEDRVARFKSFYELLPEATRDDELRAHLLAIYRGWYAWATEVLDPRGGGGEEAERRSTGLGQFASALLDGIFMQMVVAAPEFDLAAALERARRALTHVLATEGDGGG